MRQKGLSPQLKKILLMFYASPLALSMALPLLEATGLCVLMPAVFGSLAVILLMTLACLPQKGMHFISLGLFTAAVIILWTSGTLGRLWGMAISVYHLLKGNEETILAFAGQMSACVSIGMTLLCFFTLRRGTTEMIPILLGITGVAVWLGGGLPSLLMLLPAAILYAATLAYMTGGRVRGSAVLLCVLCAFGALALTSVPLKSQTVENFAQSLHEYLNNLFFFNEPREIYTLRVDGYIPLESRLGGAVSPQDTPVMTVETEHDLLMRGTAKNFYTGISWTDTLSTSRHLYASYALRNQRSAALDTDRPSDDEMLEAGIILEDVSVSMNTDSASTLFAAGHLRTLTAPRAMVLYFNDAGEVFTTRSLEAGDTYSFTAPVMDGMDTRLDPLVALLGQKSDYIDRDDWMNVPDAVAEEVHELALKLTAQCGSQLEKARAICTYLQSPVNFTYTLTPDEPPDNQDFVSWFLLREKEGYCTYFASAMTILCRCAGIPARFAEGYLAQPSGGIALVTSADAHAWTEIWLDGFGWLAFDPTPSESGRGENEEQQTPPSGSEDDPSGNDAPQNDSPATPTPPPEEPDSSEPTPSPEPTPTPVPPDEKDDEPTPSPTPPQDAATPTPPPPEDPDSRRNDFPWLILAVLAILIIIAAVYLRMRAVQPKRIASIEQNDADRFYVWMRSVLTLLSCDGMKPEPAETLYAFAERIGENAPKTFMRISVMAADIGYRGRAVTSKEEAAARECFEQIYRMVPLKVRMRWLYTTFMHGIGDIRKVP